VLRVAGVALGDPPSFHVAGVVLGDIDFHFCVAGVARMALGWLRWRAWAGVERRDAAAVGVAGVSLGDIHLRFTWHAWYLVTSTSTFAWQAWHVWHQSFTISFLFPSFPMPSLPFFCCLLEEVDMWGYPLICYVFLVGFGVKASLAPLHEPCPKVGEHRIGTGKCC
jgi:hypothetical protein